MGNERSYQSPWALDSVWFKIILGVQKKECRASGFSGETKVWAQPVTASFFSQRLCQNNGFRFVHVQSKNFDSFFCLESDSGGLQFQHSALQVWTEDCWEGGIFQSMPRTHDIEVFFSRTAPCTNWRKKGDGDGRSSGVKSIGFLQDSLQTRNLWLLEPLSLCGVLSFGLQNTGDWRIEAAHVQTLFHLEYHCSSLFLFLRCLQKCNFCGRGGEVRFGKKKKFTKRSLSCVKNSEMQHVFLCIFPAYN